MVEKDWLPARAARFNSPQGLAVDGEGNVYVADTSNNRIRKITAAGVVSTLAGTGKYGLQDGVGSSALFNYPSGIAIDGSGNLYVADQDNHVIRMIRADGLVCTVAGDGCAGYKDGHRNAARFNYPSGVAVDPAGNVIVADQGNHVVRLISTSGKVSTLAGTGDGTYRDGRAAEAAFNFPSGVAVDTSGQVYVADSYNNIIRKVAPTGFVSTLAGDGTRSYKDGEGQAARFNHPYGIATDTAGNIVVADTYNNRIRMITPAGFVNTIAGDGRRHCHAGYCPGASLNYPTGVALDNGGNLFVADTGSSRIRMLQPLYT
ncbi:MAG TPA: NHL repeat-containing protein [Puia sp.]|nr:NHL repeat-containing protein [Puia sp.]